MTHERALGSLHAFLLLLQQAQSPQQFDQMIRDQFDVYQSVGCDDQGTVLYTGYYCPIFDGRKQREGRFQHPLYRSPPDLIRDQEGTTTGRRTSDGRIVPYASRREIEEQRQLEGTEIAWLKSAFEAYVVTVQGSARLRLADGTLWELGYAGNNGHDYKPISEAMIADGLLSKKELSLQAMLRYFEQHPDQVQKYTWQNPRYIFFKETVGGPYGSIGVPVTRMRSLATDKTIFPRACLAFIDTNLPSASPGGVVTKPHAEFALDQDTGGAIRAAGRCDVYMGVGAEAEALAGRTYAEGDLYYIFKQTGAR
ncbi:MAG: MltA domain-containing protein [Planctomycetes bacterium]|nr:MltA domain-containing protein [Planctomycetota bacterium]